MSLISNDEFFEVKVYYKTKQNKTYIFDDEKDQKEDLSNYNLETFSFKRPRWGEMKDIFSKSVSLSSEGEMKVDPWKYMDRKIKCLLKEWSLVEENGEKVPITEANIDRLDYELISHLSKVIDVQFGETTSLS